MSIKVSLEMERAIQTNAIEYGLSGDIGGIPRTTYFTPAGKVIRAIKNIRHRVIRDQDGNITWQGEVDGNLDKGWLLQMPQVLKPYCPHCDRWHDTDVEVEACGIKLKAFAQKELDKAQIEEKEHTSDLEKKVAELEGLVKKLMEVQGGRVL